MTENVARNDTSDERIESNIIETADQDTSPATTLASGGFVADTEVLTTDGLIRVDELTSGDEIYALNLTTKIVKPKPVRSIERIECEDSIIKIGTRRSDLHVAADHRIPFQTKEIDQIRVQRAGDLTDRVGYKFVNDWRFPPRDWLETVEIIDFAEEYELCVKPDCHGHTFRAALPEGCEPIRRNSHSGYCFDPETFEQHREAIEAVAEETTVHSGLNHWRRPLQFDGDDFIEFLGWFVTEGSITWSQSSDTAEIGFAQMTPSHRSALNDLFDRMGLRTATSENGMSFSSPLYARVLSRLCGEDSETKRLPSFVFNLSFMQKKHLFETLIAGDGNHQQTYYTASDQLANDVLELGLYLGYKPRYTTRQGVWQLYHWKTNDGFQSDTHITQSESTETLYRPTIDDYSAIMAGRNGAFQWCGVSNVM